MTRTASIILEFGTKRPRVRIPPLRPQKNGHPLRVPVFCALVAGSEKRRPWKGRGESRRRLPVAEISSAAFSTETSELHSVESRRLRLRREAESRHETSNYIRCGAKRNLVTSISGQWRGVFAGWTQSGGFDKM